MKNKKLVLKREHISSLNDNQMDKVLGGIVSSLFYCLSLCCDPKYLTNEYYTCEGGAGSLEVGEEGDCKSPFTHLE